MGKGKYLEWELLGACSSGKRKYIKMMISRGAKNWNAGLEGACIGGHMNIVDFMLFKGADYILPLLSKEEVYKEYKRVQLLKYSKLHESLITYVMKKL